MVTLHKLSGHVTKMHRFMNFEFADMNLVCRLTDGIGLAAARMYGDVFKTKRAK